MSRRGDAGELDAKARKRVLRAIANGLFVLTTRDGDEYGAATVSWLSQASFEPPLLMVALRRKTSVWQCLSRSELAVVHVVEKGQEDVAKRFFTGCEVGAGLINGEPFEESPEGLPLLRALPHRIHARKRSMTPSGGDHDVFLLEVVALETGPAEPDPLDVAESPWEYGG